jgi:UDP-3-O-[3-hydroxymyristoyl] N-acetylglucosamine deacetylase
MGDVIIFQSCKNVFCLFLAGVVAFNPVVLYAQSSFVASLPEPGKMLAMSAAFTPVLVKGLVVHPDKPLNFDFIVDSGNDSVDSAVIKEQSARMAKYFLAAVTVPESQLWVNLSPYEKDRIIENDLGTTVLGRDMLAQDYVLKQLTASLIYPEQGPGKEFWARIYQQAQAKFGTADIPVDTFNKVWITPASAEIFEKNNAVYVTKARLKVQLDTDRLAQQTTGLIPLGGQVNQAPTAGSATTGSIAAGMNVDVGAQFIAPGDTRPANTNKSILARQLLREVIIPAIETEVNEGRNFAVIRQIYHAAILAKWYREQIRNTLLAQAYVGRNRVAGIMSDEKGVKEAVYARYMAAYTRGVFNYIREEPVFSVGDEVPRKYFSGGIQDMAMRSVPLTPAAGVSGVTLVGHPFRVSWAAERADGEPGYFSPRQATISGAVSVRGVGLHYGRDVVMTISPAPADSGIVFLVNGVPIRAAIENIRVGILKATQLSDGEGHFVLTPEHILSALGSMGINNAVIDLGESNEIPVFDGSAAEFGKFLLSDNSVRLLDAERPILRVTHPMAFFREGEGVKVIVLPAKSPQLRLSYFIKFAHPAIGAQFASFVFDPKGYWETIAPSRTFIERKDLERLNREQRFLGLSSGAGAVVLEDKEDSFSGGFTSADEAVRHKILDLFGDLQLAGFSIYGHVIAIEAGHRDHNEMVRKIVQAGEFGHVEQYTRRERGEVIRKVKALRDKGEIPDDVFQEVRAAFAPGSLPAVDSVKDGGIALRSLSMERSGHRHMLSHRVEPSMEGMSGLVPVILRVSSDQSVLKE